MDTKRLDIISMVERRRKWPAGTKARIMEEALVPGATVAEVTARNGIGRSQIYAWLRQAREGRLRGISVAPLSCSSFVPVRVEEPASALPPASRRGASAVEIALGNGRIVKVDETIDPAVLARIVNALDKPAS
jgi:transposase